MENLIFIIFILIVFLLQSLGQILERKKRKAPEEESPFEDILETLGLPYPEEKETPLEIVVEEPVKKKEIEKEEKTEIPQVREEKIKESLTLGKEESFSLKDMENAIIYSAIIGPPKALRIRRSGGIGRHA